MVEGSGHVSNKGCLSADTAANCKKIWIAFFYMFEVRQNYRDNKYSTRLPTPPICPRSEPQMCVELVEVSYDSLCASSQIERGLPSSFLRVLQSTNVGSLMHRAHVAVALVSRLSASFHDASLACVSRTNDKQQIHNEGKSNKAKERSSST